MTTHHITNDVRAFRRSYAGFTLRELIIILAAVALFAAIAFYTSVRRPIDWAQRAPRAMCINNLKQFSVSLNTWATDYGDRWPWLIQSNAPGPVQWLFRGDSTPLLCFMSNELSTPKLLACPADSRQPAEDFRKLGRPNVSYFLSMDASPTAPRSVVAGDRNLSVAGKAALPGLLSLPLSGPLSWTPAMHSSGETNPCGNILFADGHAETFWGSLNAAVQEQGLPTNRVAVP